MHLFKKTKVKITK